jgi:predicted nucleotidyltransferase
LPIHRATNDIDFRLIVETWDQFTWLRDEPAPIELWSKSILSCPRKLVIP